MKLLDAGGWLLQDVSAMFQGGQSGGSSEGWCLPLRSFEMVQCRVVPQKSCIWMAEKFASKLSTGELTKFCSTLFFSKIPETGILCETGNFYLKLCHGMFLVVALFPSTDGRNM